MAEEFNKEQAEKKRAEIAFNLHECKKCHCEFQGDISCTCNMETASSVHIDGDIDIDASGHAKVTPSADTANNKNNNGGEE